MNECDIPGAGGVIVVLDFNGLAHNFILLQLYCIRVFFLFLVNCKWRISRQINKWMNECDIPGVGGVIVVLGFNSLAHSFILLWLNPFKLSVEREG